MVVAVSWESDSPVLAAGEEASKWKSGEVESGSTNDHKNTYVHVLLGATPGGFLLLSRSGIDVLYGVHVDEEAKVRRIVLTEDDRDEDDDETPSTTTTTRSRMLGL